MCKKVCPSTELKMQSLILLILSLIFNVKGLTITIQALPSTSVVEGKPLTLRCTMTDVPSTLRTCHIEWTRNYNTKAVVTTQLLTSGNGTRVVQQPWSHGTMTSYLSMQRFHLSNTGRYNCALRCGHLGQIIGSTSADIYKVGGHKGNGEEQKQKGLLEMYGVENLVGIIIVMVTVLACSVVVIVLTRPFSARRHRAQQHQGNLAVRSPSHRSNEISIELPPSYSFMFPRDNEESGGDSSRHRSPGEVEYRGQHPGRCSISSPSSLTQLPNYSFALRDLKAKGLAESPLELSPAPPTYASVRVPENPWSTTSRSATPPVAQMPSNLIYLPRPTGAEPSGTGPTRARSEPQNISSVGRVAQNLSSTSVVGQNLSPTATEAQINASIRPVAHNFSSPGTATQHLSSTEVPQNLSSTGPMARIPSSAGPLPEDLSSVRMMAQNSIPTGPAGQRLYSTERFNNGATPTTNTNL